MKTCFEIYFNPIYQYIKDSINLAFDNNSVIFYMMLLISTSVDLTIKFINEFFKLNYFGVNNLLILLVILTILIDAFYGIKKSVREQKLFLLMAKSDKITSSDRKALLKKADLKKFDIVKLQFTFFKILTLLAYLFFAKNILEIDYDDNTFSEVLGFTTGVIIKIPLAIFWYKDFKSIGDNLEFLLKKKPPIFPIIEGIFELKFKKYNNTLKKESDE